MDQTMFTRVRKKLIFFYTLITFFVLLLFSSVVYFISKFNSYQDFDKDIESKANDLSALIQNTDEEGEFRLALKNTDFNDPNFYIQIISNTGKTMWKSSNLLQKNLQYSLPKLEGLLPGQSMWTEYEFRSGVGVRQLIKPINAGKSKRINYLIAANEDADMEKVLHTFWKTIIFVNGISVVLIYFLGILFTRKTLEPVKVAYEKQHRFAADASHEFRTPLANLMGEISLALSKERNKEEYQGSLKSCLEEVQNMTHITENLLSLAKLDTKLRAARVSQNINLRNIIEEIVHNLSKSIEQKNLNLEIEILPDLSLPGSKEEMRILFHNLIDNAVKYSLKNGWIKITGEKNKGKTVINVSDNGIGIPKEEQEKIFERFYRVDKARSRQSGGSGLGLSIAKAIVKNHKGTITVTSEPNKRSAFTIIFQSDSQ